LCAAILAFYAKDRFDKENEARKTIAQILGGAAVLVGLWFTSQQMRISQETLRVVEQGQSTVALFLVPGNPRCDFAVLRILE
jgi:hypothetical protein